MNNYLRRTAFLLFCITCFLSSIQLKAQSSSQGLLSAHDTVGCIPFQVKFSSHVAGATSYKWDFGNGNTSVQKDPVNVYTAPGYYTVKLTAVSGGNTVTETRTRLIRVVPNPTASFSVNKTEICQNESIQFSNASANAVSYIWDFGDGATSIEKAPVHRYNQHGEFTVKLIATNAFGCNDVAVKTKLIKVNRKPVADISVSNTTSCDSTETFSFSSTDKSAVSWLWNFGDGKTSTQATPSHKYGRTGKYDVQLILTTAKGCKDTIDMPGLVNIYKPQLPSFTAQSNEACKGSIVRFSTTTPGTSYVWDFGNGTTSTEKDAVCTYTDEGSYTVTLSVTDSNGCSNSHSIENFIKVKGTVKAAFTGGGMGCPPYQASFSNKSENAIAWLWEFGDGDSSVDENPVHTYDSAGVYTVSLHAYGANGCEYVYTKDTAVEVIPFPVSTFSSSVMSGCPPLKVKFRNRSSNAVKYQWSFGDGATATTAEPEHEFKKEGTYTVTLRTYNQLGCKDTAAAEMEIVVKHPEVDYQAPKAIKGCPPFSATFSDATLGNVRWHWDFGDGATSGKQTPTHTYTKPGIYNVALTAYDKDGCRKQFKEFQQVEVQEVNAGFSVKQTTCPPYVTAFEDNSTGATSWYWDFGDGTTSTERNPAHTFTGGKFNVTLTISSDGGCSKTLTKTVNYPKFSARISPEKADTVFPATVQFYSNSEGATSWFWDFGDGNTSAQRDPEHTFVQKGKYKVKLTIANAKCTLTYTVDPFSYKEKDSTKTEDGKEPIPFKAGFSVSSIGGCVPLVVNFKNSSTQSVGYFWDFGDGNTSTAYNPQHVYQKPGNYRVKLVSFDKMGVGDTTYTIVKATQAKADFKVHQVFYPDKSVVNFEDVSKAGMQWHWDFGDSSFSTQQHPVHIYSGKVKMYPVTLTVTDSGGCINSTTRIIYNGYQDNVYFSHGKACTYDSVKFSTHLQGYSGYRWDFGDSTYSTDSIARHKYAKAGVYKPSLKVTDDNGYTFEYVSSSKIPVFDPKAYFTHSAKVVNCDSLTVRFFNGSTGADGWYWEFGDGTTSTEKDPVHFYSKPGVYSVALTAMKQGCKDIFVMKELVTVHGAKPLFTSTQDKLCFPLTVSFTDLSKDAVSWHWDFGDGTSSTEQHPKHSFSKMPAKQVTLTITDINGCTGKITKPGFNLVSAGLKADRTEGCAPFIVKFANKSLFSESWYWDFGDGTTSTEEHPSHTYAQAGQYTVKLVAYAKDGCTAEVLMKDYIRTYKPEAAFSSPYQPSCAPAYVTFTDLSQRATEWNWNFGDGSWSAERNPGHIYEKPGSYTVTLIAKDQKGCTDTMIMKDFVKVLGPISDFSASALEACPGTEISFTDRSTDAVKWEWNFGDGTSSTERNPAHVFNVPGTYVVTLITHDKFGCSSFYSPKPGITIFDNQAPDASAITRVSVVSNTETIIEWKATTAKDFDVYRVYRLERNDGNYKLVGTINDAATTSFIDKGLHTLENTYTYKVQTADRCGYVIDLEYLTPHTTINVEAKVSESKIHLNWTPYEGCAVKAYNIYRETMGGTPQWIGAVTPDKFSFTDSTIFCPVPYSYRIVASGLCGNQVLSYSDTAIGVPENPFLEQKLDVVRSTVVNNQYVLTEWKSPAVLPHKVTGYDIYRSENGGQYTKIASVLQYANSYEDKQVKVGDNRYDYLVVPTNSCGAQSGEGLKGNSILLTGNSGNGKIHLKWNAYEHWTSGVQYYLVEELMPDGTWKVIGKTSDTKLTTE